MIKKNKFISLYSRALSALLWISKPEFLRHRLYILCCLSSSASVVDLIASSLCLDLNCVIVLECRLLIMALLLICLMWYLKCWKSYLRRSEMKLKVYLSQWYNYPKGWSNSMITSIHCVGPPPRISPVGVLFIWL